MLVKEIDIHGLYREEAIDAVENALNHCGKEAMILRVIHGYHGGITLQTAIRSHFSNHEKVQRIELGLNPGETDLIIGKGKDH